MSDLQIPAESQEALADLYATAHRGVWLSADEKSDYAQTIVAPAVAAELRRQADALDEWAGPGDQDGHHRLPEPNTLHVVAARLRARADELDGGTS